MHHEPSGSWLWLRTGRRRAITKATGWGAALIAGYQMLGPASSPGMVQLLASTDPLPGPIADSQIYPDKLPAGTAEKLLGSPLLESTKLLDNGQILGYWGKQFQGAFGMTVIVFQVYYTPRDTWLTVTQISSEYPAGDSPLEEIMTQPVDVQGHKGRMFHQPGERTVDWHITPNLWAIFSEQVPSRVDDRPSSGWIDQPLLTSDQFVAIASRLGPRGTRIGPFTFNLPW